MKLRDYQQKAVDSIFNEWARGNKSTLAVLPTGTGKTVIFAGVIQRMLPKRTMVLAHREELIFQAKDKIERVTGMKADIEMGQYKSSNNGDLFMPGNNVIVSTVQTHTAGGDGAGRMTKFNPDDFGLLIVDEAHHATSPSYQRIIKYYQCNSNLVVLGVTATPDRSDEEALGQVFGTVAFDYEILDAIKDGWLVPIDQQVVPVGEIDLRSVRTTAGDLNGSDLAEVMEAEKPLHGVAYSTIEIIQKRRGIGFASSVEHAKKLSEIFNRYRSGMSAWVCGKTDKDERKSIVADFAAGKIQFVWNCGVFTEGFDDSGVEVIAMARPTKSRALYAQMAGRSTRPHDSIAHQLNNVSGACLRRSMIARSVKPNCLLLDYAGNSGKHKLITAADILGGNVSDEAIEATFNLAKGFGKPIRVEKVLAEEEEKEQKKKQELARKAKILAKKVDYKTKFIDPFDALQIQPTKPRGWDNGKQLSEGQKKVLRNMGVNPEGYEYHQAKQILDKQFEIWKKAKEGGYHACTLKMINRLKRFGVNALTMPIETGRAYLDAIARNGWRGIPNDFKPPQKSKMTPPPRQSVVDRVAIPFDDGDDIPF